MIQVRSHLLEPSPKPSRVEINNRLLYRIRDHSDNKSSSLDFPKVIYAYETPVQSRPIENLRSR